MARGQYESGNEQARTQDILDTADALRLERSRGSTIKQEAQEGKLREGTVAGFKSWMENMRSETAKRLREVQLQLVVAEEFAKLSTEEQEKAPIANRPLRVSYARELVRQLTDATASFNREIEIAEETLLAEAARRISH